MIEQIYSRTNLLLGKENVEILKNAHVIICGIGGVGSFTLETLARVGIGKITVIDKDVVDITNINRQIIALNSTVGKNKVDVALERIKDINSNIIVNTKKINITKNNIDEILSMEKIDYVVDCVDNIEAKIAIIEFCNKENIKCISCMGTAKKINPLDLRITDIYKTSICPLAKIVRKRLRELNIKKQKVLYSVEEPKKVHQDDIGEKNFLGSVSFVPSCAGIIIASEVVKDILKL